MRAGSAKDQIAARESGAIGHRAAGDVDLERAAADRVRIGAAIACKTADDFRLAVQIDRAAVECDRVRVGDLVAPGAGQPCRAAIQDESIGDGMNTTRAGLVQQHNAIADIDRAARVVSRALEIQGAGADFDQRTGAAQSA